MKTGNLKTVGAAPKVYLAPLTGLAKPEKFWLRPCTENYFRLSAARMSLASIALG